jgi:hypothetical protein
MDRSWGLGKQTAQAWAKKSSSVYYILIFLRSWRLKCVCTSTIYHAVMAEGDDSPPQKGGAIYAHRKGVYTWS